MKRLPLSILQAKGLAKGTPTINEWKKVKTERGYILLMATTVLTVRYHAITRIHDKSDSEAVQYTQDVADAISTNVIYFVTPDPALSALTTASAELTTALSSGTKAQQREKREVLNNLIADEALYVTKIANLAANISPGPIVIIEAANMEVQKVTPRGKITDLHVLAGGVQASLLCDSAAIVGGHGTHDYQFRKVQSPALDWVQGPLGTKAKVTLSNLERATFVEVRHRIIGKNGASDWEVHEPVVVP